MYTIYRNNRKFRKTTFPTYEQARQEVRKYLRKTFGAETYNTTIGASSIDGAGAWDSVSRNPPSLSAVGFEIRRVDA
jgi:hypothetical protein